MNKKRYLFAIALGILIVGMVAIVAKERRRPAFYEEPFIPLKFSHKNHVVELKISCEHCHKDAVLSTNAADNLLPDETTCAECHHENTRTTPTETASKRCLQCHTFDTSNSVAPPRIDYPQPDLKFSHKKHIQNGIACSRCHSAIIQNTGFVLPSMQTCLECHTAGKTDPNYCSKCHVEGVGGVVKTKLAPQSGTLDHRWNWLLRHGRVAKLDRQTCASCHKQTECFSCHGSMVKPSRFHPADWKLVHAAEGRKRPESCSVCHNFAHDCQRCHQRLGVHPSVIGDKTKGFSVHPPGWADCTLNVNHHSYQARRSLATCAACHTESTCISCHKPGGRCGTLISPHRHLSKDKLKRMKNRNPETCRKCHGNSIPF